MLLPSPMERLSIFLSGSDVEKATILLARSGDFHACFPGKRETAGHDGWHDLAGTYGRQVERLEKLLERLGLPVADPVVPAALAPDQDADNAREAIDQAESAVTEWLKRKEVCDAEIEHLEHLLSEVHRFSPLDLPMEEIRSPEFLHWVVGTLPRENLATLRLALFDTVGGQRRHQPHKARRVNMFLPEETAEATAAALTRHPDFAFEHQGERLPGGSDANWEGIYQGFEDLEKRLQAVLDALDISPPSLPFPERLSPSRDLEGMAAEVEAAEKEVADVQSRAEASRRKVESLAGLLDLLGEISPLDVPLETLPNLSFLQVFVGTLPAERFDDLKLTFAGIPAVVAFFQTQPGRVLVTAAALKDHAPILESALESAAMTFLPLPDGVRGTPAAAIEETSRRLDGARALLNHDQSARKALAGRRRPELLNLYRRIVAGRQVARVLSGAPREGRMVLLTGRVAPRAMDPVLITLQNAARGQAEIEFPEPGRPESSVPVELLVYRIPFVVIPLAARRDRLLVAAATDNRHAENLDRALAGVFMEPIPFPRDLKGKPAELIPEIQTRLDKARNRRQDLTKERDALARRWGDRLRGMWAQAAANLQVIRAITRFDRREDTFLISGWVPGSRVERLLDALEATLAGRVDVEVEKAPAGGRRRPPTLLANPRLLRPFELIVATFGVPDAHEIDPTPLVALVFPLLFGMMFGDVGHGAVIASLGALLLKRSHKAVKSLGAILAASGAAGILFGFLYGSFFGREDIIPAIWQNPLADLTAILGLSILAGIVVIGIGFAVSLVNAFRQRQWRDFVCGPNGLAGLGLYLALVGGGYAAYENRITLPALLLFLSIPSLLLFLRRPLGRLFTGKRPLITGGRATFTVEAFFEVFEAWLNTFSNTFSFVRLGAFAVAHAGLMRVVFSLAEWNSPPAGWLIIAVGTVLVVGLEGLVVAIQALRLDYYEFFSRFYTGRGTPFSPFRLTRTRKAHNL